MKKIFISYAREDAGIAMRLYDDLKKAGLDPWIDKVNLIPGQNWKVAINQAIKSCKYFIPLLSTSSIKKRGYVQKEFKYGLKVLEEIPPDEIFVIPTRIDPCEVRYEELRDLQWADLFPSYESGLKDILRALSAEGQSEDNLYDNERMTRRAIQNDVNQLESLKKSASDLINQIEEKLQYISHNFQQPGVVREAAGKILIKSRSSKLKSAVSSFETTTPLIFSYIQDLKQLLEIIARNSFGDAFANVIGLLDMTGAVYLKVAGIADEHPYPAIDTTVMSGGSSEEREVEEIASSAALTFAPTEAADDLGIAEAAPPPGKVTPSKHYPEIAGEYRAMFAAAKIKPETASVLYNTCRIVTTNRNIYESVAQPLCIPWWFVAIIHGLECGFKFSRHLHNGDPLTYHARSYPPGRPFSSGNPPNTWEESAKDAMEYNKLANLSNWSLPKVLYRWERYNGMGYRLRGIPSPYLWSFTDRYISGKYVADNMFEPSAVFKQAGAAAVLKRLIEQGVVDIT